MGLDSGGGISGTFQLQSVQRPSGTHTFDALMNVPIPFTISYDTARITRDPFSTSLETGPVTVQFGGPASALLDEEFALALSGQSLRIDLTAAGDGILIAISPLMNIVGGTVDQLDLILPPVTGTYDANGSPQLGTFVADAEVRLTRNQAVASGVGPITVEAR